MGIAVGTVNYGAAHASSPAASREVFSLLPLPCPQLCSGFLSLGCGRSPRGGFRSGSTVFSPLLAWRHGDFAEQFCTVIRARKMHLLHLPLVRCLGGACFIETSGPTDVQHFINSALIHRLIDSSRNCLYDYDVTCLRVCRTRTYNVSGAFKPTIFAALSDAVPPVRSH